VSNLLFFCEITDSTNQVYKQNLISGGS